MLLSRRLVRFPPQERGGAVAIGNFDGVHHGHARLLERLVATARSVGGPAVVLTFDPHPAVLLRPDRAPERLTTIDRRADLLARQGVEIVSVLATDRALLDQSPEAFFRRTVVEAVGAAAIVEGPNFFFGRDRAGTTETLRRLAAEAGLACEIVPATGQDLASVPDPTSPGGSEAGVPLISSSVVRERLLAGDVAGAGRLLTAPYRLSGTVGRGDRRGRTIGFPTANVERITTLLPAAGVYAALAHTVRGPFPAAVHVGAAPTFGSEAVRVEAHLIGFSGWLYGTPIDVDFVDRVRGVMRFSGVEALKQQLTEDVAAASALVLSWMSPPTRGSI